MIGVYDYTVILTYLSLISGVLGIITAVTGVGHPEIGIFFLMVSGILDAFDGTVARTKKNRTEIEKNFGVQIDSLTDLICFGVLPVSIGLAQLRIRIRAEEARKNGFSYYIGVPVTTSALVFPLIMVIHFLSNWDMTLFYFLTMLVMTIAFVVNIKVRKPGKLGLVIIIAIGLIEFILCILAFGNYEG